MGCRLLVIELVHCGSNSILKLRFFWTPYISPPHTLLSLCYPVSFQASCKIAQYCSTSIASKVNYIQSKSDYYRMNNKLTAFACH